MTWYLYEGVSIIDTEDDQYEWLNIETNKYVKSRTLLEATIAIGKITMRYNSKKISDLTKEIDSLKKNNLKIDKEIQENSEKFI